MSRIRFTLLALMALALGTPAAAQQQNQLSVAVENRSAALEAARGTPRSDEAARAGDVLRYRLTFRNTTPRALRGVVVSDPIPAGLRFVAGSSRASRADARVEYSVDGGRTFAAQPMETVVVDGRREQRPAAPEKYTHVRWTVGGEVAPGATVVAEFDARLGAQARPAGTAASPAAGNGGR